MLCRRSGHLRPPDQPILCRRSGHLRPPDQPMLCRRPGLLRPPDQPLLCMRSGLFRLSTCPCCTGRHWLRPQYCKRATRAWQMAIISIDFSTFFFRPDIIYSWKMMFDKVNNILDWPTRTVCCHSRRTVSRTVESIHWHALYYTVLVTDKFCMLVYKCRRNETPAYLVEMLHHVVPSSRYNLRSESEKM